MTARRHDWLPLPPTPASCSCPPTSAASGVHPPLDFAGYRSTALRHPKQPLVLLPHRLTEITGPLLGGDLITATDADLTTQHAGEPHRPADHRDRAGARLRRPAGARTR